MGGNESGASSLVAPYAGPMVVARQGAARVYELREELEVLIHIPIT